jgi:hypothetical protein
VEHVFSVFASVIPDLRPVEELLPPTFWEKHRGAILSGAFLAALVFVVAFRWLRRTRPVTVTPPATVARTTLQELKTAPDNGFLAGVVLNALRQYLESLVPALQRRKLTVDEIIRQLERETSLPHELQNEIAILLRQCERWQFSKGRRDLPAKLANRALDLIARIEATRVAPAAVCARQP